MRDPRDQSSPPRPSARAGAVRSAVVWVLGASAALARLNWRDQEVWPVAAVLAAAAVAIVVALQPVVGSGRWRRAVGAVSAAVLVVVATRWGYAYPAAVVLVGTCLAYGALVRWSLPERWPQRTGAVAGPAVGPLVLAMLSWYREGDPVTFALLAIASVALLELYARRHGVAARIDRVMGRVAERAASAVTTVLAGLVMVLVVEPVHLVSRLFRYSPLDGGRATPATAWIDVDPGRLRDHDGLAARPDSMGLRETRPTRSVRRRGHLRLLVPVLGIGIVAAAALPLQLRLPWAADEGPATAAGRQSTFTREFEDDPAFRDAPWAENLRLGLLEAWSNLEFNAALGGWQIRDVASEYINVTGGERRTLRPDAALGEPVVVWLMGGSAAFGAGQRDEHTIASELVRRAEREGIPLEVRNIAVPATVNWQTAMQLIARLQWEPPPDLVVVYDGANDLALQGVLADQGKGASDEPASLIDGEFDAILRERARAAGATSADLPDVVPTEPDATVPPDAAGRIVAARYLKGVEVIRQFCAAASVPVVFFWQPELRTKQPLTEVDRDTLVDVDVDPDSLGAWRTFSSAARSEVVAGGVNDLTGVFDGVSEPIYWDTVHTNELGAELVAGAIFDQLAPALDGLRAGS